MISKGYPRSFFNRSLIDHICSSFWDSKPVLRSLFYFWAFLCQLFRFLSLNCYICSYNNISLTPSLYLYLLHLLIYFNPTLLYVSKHSFKIKLIYRISLNREFLGTAQGSNNTSEDYGNPISKNLQGKNIPPPHNQIPERQEEN